MTPPVVLSMTTTPARNGTLGPTLYSLRMQSVPDVALRIYAALDCAVPTESWVPSFDYGPVTKIAAVVDTTIPDDAIVVTVDDDIIYERTWLEQILAGAETFPACAVGFSGWHVDRFRRGEHDYRWARPGAACDVLEGWAGVAYRKLWFGPEILMPPSDFRLVDDVWISSYLARKGIGRRVIGQGTPAAPAQNGPPGLHDRADFKAMNERAALLGFP